AAPALAQGARTGGRLQADSAKFARSDREERRRAVRHRLDRRNHCVTHGHLSPKRLFALIPMALAATLAGCGGDGDPQPAATISSSPSPSLAATTTTATPSASRQPELSVYDVPAGSHPHDVAPAADGGVWYTAQATGRLGWLNPATGETREVSLGDGSAP